MGQHFQSGNFDQTGKVREIYQNTGKVTEICQPVKIKETRCHTLHKNINFKKS